ncbi:thermonuclease family protein [Moraxella sp. ZJ142]|uniref:thermonuclease family protein n=1 Tax=Moraxella marmotae TaxID=3344520 RepID=UPI0035D4A300
MIRTLVLILGALVLLFLYQETQKTGTAPSIVNTVIEKSADALPEEKVEQVANLVEKAGQAAGVKLQNAEKTAAEVAQKDKVKKGYDKHCKIVGITDGDTATCLTASNERIKIRFANIDAPESKQAFGTKSKQVLSDLIFNKEVDLKIDTVDRYGRSVAEVFVDDMNVNKHMVKMGWAWAYKEYLKDPHYLELQEKAQEFKEGLWIDKTAVYPQDWRRQQKEQRAAKKAAEQNN